MSDRKHTYLFNPSQKDRNLLKAEFVVRTAIFEQVFTDIQSDTMQKPPQHYMLLGQRGMGKTTMLLRLKYAIEDDEKLNKWLLPIVFNEEQYSMPDLASFFEHIAKLLTEDYPSYTKLLDSMRVHEYEQDYEQKAYEVLVDYLKENQQKIIIFHDNFGQFLEKIGKISTHRLRNILMNSTHIRLVGASATLLEHTFNYKEPFFDFFYQIRLKGINLNETALLFEKLAENEGKTEELKEILKTERPRIDVMRKLSGGIIRTMVMLFDIFIDNQKQDSFKDLEAILDRVTPLYKHRMDDLKPQQQLIVDAVAKAWDAVSVSEIAEIARADRQGLKTNQISAQLKQLVDNQIIEIEPRATGRTNLYRLQERFFNIWYLMRYSNKQDKQRVIWLVKFLEDWCKTNDLKQLLDRFENHSENRTYELSTVFDKILAYSMVSNNEVLEEELDTLIKAINHLEEADFDKEALKLVSQQLQNIKKSETKRMDFITDIGYIFYKNNEQINTYLTYIKYQEVDSKMNLKQFIHKKEAFLIYIQNQRFFHIILSLITNDETPIDYQNFHTIIRTISITFQHVFFTILLAKKQYYTAYKLFEVSPEELNLKDRLKPIYFLTMEYLKDEYPNEYLKAGEEYRETIEELKERVKWFEKNIE